MDKTTAESIVRVAKAMDREIGNLFALVRRIEDAALRARFESAVEELMGQVAHDLIFPIEKMYPDLNPDT